MGHGKFPLSKASGEETTSTIDPPRRKPIPIDSTTDVPPPQNEQEPPRRKPIPIGVIENPPDPILIEQPKLWIDKKGTPHSGVHMTQLGGHQTNLHNLYIS